MIKVIIHNYRVSFHLVPTNDKKNTNYLNSEVDKENNYYMIWKKSTIFYILYCFKV